MRDGAGLCERCGAMHELCASDAQAMHGTECHAGGRKLSDVRWVGAPGRRSPLLVLLRVWQPEHGMYERYTMQAIDVVTMRCNAVGDRGNASDVRVRRGAPLSAPQSQLQSGETPMCCEGEAEPAWQRHPALCRRLPGSVSRVRQRRPEHGWAVLGSYTEAQSRCQFVMPRAQRAWKSGSRSDSQRRCTRHSIVDMP